MFSLAKTKYTYIKQMAVDEVKSMDPSNFKAPFIVPNYSFSFSSAEKESFQEEWKNFMEDWEVSDMRITHGRAQLVVDDV